MVVAPLSNALVAGVVLIAASATTAHAQLNTQHIKGVVGLKAGSQPPPHWYFTAPLIYTYNTDTVRNRDGDRVGAGNAEITMVVYGVGVYKVTARKLLGGFYGFQVLFAGVNNRLQGTDIDLNPGGGITDTFAQPINLGWHFKRADALAYYGIYLPTGRYTDGARDNTGLGMWGHEIGIGTTVFLNEGRRYHLATLATFNFQSKKEDSETKVGNTMNLEGGAGADFLEGGLTAGLNYYASFKLTEDRIEGIPGILIRGKNRVFALGPELSLAIARGGVLYGFLKATYQWEVYARTTTQGGAFNITATFPVRPIRVQKP